MIHVMFDIHMIIVLTLEQYVEVEHSTNYIAFHEFLDRVLIIYREHVIFNFYKSFQSI
jgi:predicted transport protein